MSFRVGIQIIHEKGPHRRIATEIILTVFVIIPVNHINYQIPEHTFQCVMDFLLINEVLFHEIEQLYHSSDILHTIRVAKRVH